MNAADFFPLTFLIAAFITSLFVSLKSMRNKKGKLPPGPRKLPIIGNLHQIGKLPHKTLKTLATKHGRDLMSLQLGSVSAVIVSSPDAAREIFRRHDRAFSGRPTLWINKIFYGDKSVSVVAVSLKKKEMRKLLVSELMTAKRIQSFARARAHGVALMVDAVARGASRNEPVDLSSLAFSLANNLVCHVALGLRSGVDGERSRRFQELLHVVQRLAGEVSVGDYFPWLAWVNKINGRDRLLDRSFADMDEFFDAVIREHVDRRKGFDGEKDGEDEDEDIVDVFLRLQKDSNRGLTVEQMKGVLADVFIAGTDTSAATIEWTMSELMRNPKIKQKAQHELRQLTKTLQGRPQPPVQEKDLSELKYLNQVIKESFRLHPPAPLLVPKETTEECTVKINGEEYEIPRKTRVLFNASAIQRDDRYYKDPEKFCPERFDDGRIDYRGKSFELMPFGSGRRSCPGISFAMPVVELALANLLCCFDWEFAEGVTGESLDMEEALGVTMHRRTPLVLVATRVKYNMATNIC